MQLQKSDDKQSERESQLKGEQGFLAKTPSRNSRSDSNERINKKSVEVYERGSGDEGGCGDVE